LFVGARFVLATEAEPPHQDEAYAILECQPTGVLSDADEALMSGCRSGDLTTVNAALRAGARVNGWDARGMTALHVATAYRRPAIVALLLAAGADPDAQCGYGNAPHFAAVDPQGDVGPCATRIDDVDHERIVRMLVDAGAGLDATDPYGITLLDLVLATRPYPTELVRLLVNMGAGSAMLADRSLVDLLAWLPEGWTRAEVVANQVRFLLESGADPNRPCRKFFGGGLSPSMTALDALFQDRPYEQELDVPGDVLLELVDLLLRHEVRDTVGPHGRTALQHAQARLDQGLTDYQPIVDRLRKAAASNGKTSAATAESY
jgi:hypothetical protein